MHVVTRKGSWSDVTGCAVRERAEEGIRVVAASSAGVVGHDAGKVVGDLDVGALDELDGM